jgi:hypothetical protein
VRVCMYACICTYVGRCLCVCVWVGEHPIPHPITTTPLAHTLPRQIEAPTQEDFDMWMAAIKRAARLTFNIPIEDTTAPVAPPRRVRAPGAPSLCVSLACSLACLHKVRAIS